MPFELAGRGDCRFNGAPFRWWWFALSILMVAVLLAAFFLWIEPSHNLAVHQLFGLALFVGTAALSRVVRRRTSTYAEAEPSQPGSVRVTPLSPAVRPPRRASQLTIWFFVLSAIASAGGLFFALRDLALSHGLPGASRQSALTWNRLNFLGGYEFGVYLAVLPIGVVWLVRQYRADRLLQASGAPGLKFSPAWAVGWWFVPLANLVMPLLVMREIWTKAVPRPAGERTRLAEDVFLLTWWVAWLARSGLLAMADWTMRAPLAELQNHTVAEASAFLAWFDVASIASALLAMALVQQVSRELDEIRAVAHA